MEEIQNNEHEKLSHSEDLTVDFMTNIEIKQGLTQKNPKLSERLKIKIQSKFTPEDFKGVNAFKRKVHGTSFRAIYPLWMGTGLVSLVQGVYERPSVSGRMPKENAKIKGTFTIVGEAMALSKYGFGPDNNGIRRISENHWPIYIVGEKLPFGLYSSALDEPCAIVLALWEHNLIDSKIDEYQTMAEQTESGKELRHIYPTPNRALDYLVKKAASDLKNPHLRNNICDQLINFDNSAPKDPFFNRSNISLLSKEEEVKLRSIYYQFLVKNLSDTELSQAIQKYVSNLQRLKNKNSEKCLWLWSTKDEIYLTVDEMTNYCANIMLRGVDKSKIFPIYDWNGKLLWPK